MDSDRTEGATSFLFLLLPALSGCEAALHLLFRAHERFPAYFICYLSSPNTTAARHVLSAGPTRELVLLSSSLCELRDREQLAFVLCSCVWQQKERRKPSAVCCFLPSLLLRRARVRVLKFVVSPPTLYSSVYFYFHSLSLRCQHLWSCLYDPCCSYP